MVKKGYRKGIYGLAAGMLLTGAALPASAGEWDVAGFVENATYFRKDVGLSKFRNTAQVEAQYDFQPSSMTRFTINATLRGTYDGVYDLNSSDYGDKAGGSVMLSNSGVPGANPGEFIAGVGPTGLPWGGGIINGVSAAVALGLPNNAFGFDLTGNPNEGLGLLGASLHGGSHTGQVGLAAPLRPCNVDPRGCIDGYLDFTENDLRFPEFNSRQDWLRELYVDMAWDVGNLQELSIRLGRQQVIWGRTDLFRVLDVINPVDYSRNNIYDELEDIRIPQWMVNAEYRMGAVGGFEDLNVSMVWNFDRFRPSNVGQAGTPNQIIGAGELFRALNTCWEYGCTVANFAGGLVTTDFGPGIIGIRQADMPAWSLDNTQIGAKVEGVYDGVGFSLNYLSYLAQLPSLRGGIPATNAFTGEGPQPWPYLIAFDIAFPRVHLFGGSMDFYADSIKSVFRVEVAYTTGEEFANTLRPELYSKSDVLRYVIGWDRDTFIPFLNKTKAFLFSAQLFGEHILDHELEESAGSALGLPGFTKAGIPNWKDNWIATLLIKGWYNNNLLSPQIIAAYDVRGKAVTIAPSINWLITDNWEITAGANFKVGKGARSFDDCRSCNPFGPYSASPLHADPFGAGSVGLASFEPLGRFRSGPLGMAQNEDEIQVTVRYRF